MATIVTFRLDRETERILRELAPRGRGAKSRLLREALRTHWRALQVASAPSSWEIYAALGIAPTNGRKRDRARHVEVLLKEKLRAKRRAGTL